MKVSTITIQLVLNSRLDTIQAAILRAKLRHLDDFNEARNKAAEFYDNTLAEIPQVKIPERSKSSTHIFHQYTIRVPASDRDALKEHLENEGIPAMIYYPVPLHVQKAYQHLGYKETDFPVTVMLCNEVLSLPMHTELTEEHLFT